MLFVDAEIVRISADVFQRKFWIKAVIAGRDRRVRSENAGTCDAMNGCGEIDRPAREAPMRSRAANAAWPSFM